MILLIYFVLAIVLGISMYYFNHRTFTQAAMFTFLVAQTAVLGFGFVHLNENQLLYFRFDKLGMIFLSILTLLAFTTTKHSLIYLKNDVVKSHSIYFIAFMGLTTALTGAYLADSLIVTWIFVEATTLMAAMLIYHDRTPLALEATWKYVFICSTGIAMAYMGLLFLSSVVESPENDFLSFAMLGKAVKAANPLYLKITFLLVLVGYSTKMELFPMHTAGIDANSVAPPPVAAFISTVIANMGFLSIFRIYAVLSQNDSIHTWASNVLILAGVLSLLIAAGYMLKAVHNKRMLAYSSLENMGIAAIAVGLGGKAYYVAILHIILHSFTKASLFYQLGQSFRVMGSYRLNESGLYFKKNPLGGVVFLLGMFCICGIPPSGMFVTEYLLFKSLIAAGKWWVLVMVVVLLSCVVYGLVTRIFHILYSVPRDKVQAANVEQIPFYESLSQFLLLGMVMVLCFYQPAFLMEFIRNAVDELFKI